ncbi:MAG TPA: hypothetical protein VM889_10820 [Candidatus Thermoplasmatota archaeon]|nr:hypothetical protein [Candidatus Thermoplasmatota archaeon]
MPTLIRRLEGSLVEVMFGKPIEPGSSTAEKLTEFAADPAVHLIMDDEDRITGVQCQEKAYIRFLQSVNSSRETIAAFRAALDDSKKASRERMRR